MNLFPSRGLAVHGVEIKVARGDLIKELAQPQKADEIAQFCDFWYVATPKGLCDPDELPITWGLLELHDNGAIRERKKATKLEAKPLSRVFIAAMARRINQLDEVTISKIAEEKIKPERDRLDKQAAELREERNKYPHGLMDKYNELRAEIDAFEAAIGFKIRDGWRGSEDICRAAEVVRRIGVADTYGNVTNLKTTLSKMLEQINCATAAFSQGA